jgi:Ala-tRNA(Pro) deacylase
MAVAMSLRDYLDSRGIAYEVLSHPRAMTMVASARAAGVPADSVVKAVVLEDEDGYLLAAVPADRHLELGELRRWLNRRLGLATEDEIAELFRDCEVGAVPAVGAAYGIETVCEDDLRARPMVYLEAGDHQTLLRLNPAEFDKLMAGARHGHFSRVE